MISAISSYESSSSSRRARTRAGARGGSHWRRGSPPGPRRAAGSARGRPRVAGIEPEPAPSDSASDGDRRLGDLVARLGSPAPLDQVVARVARRGEDIRAERELAALEIRQPLEDAYERLLRGVGGVVLGSEDAVAEVVRALLVAAVELREGIAVAAGGLRREAGLIGARSGGASRTAHRAPSEGCLDLRDEPLGDAYHRPSNRATVTELRSTDGEPTPTYGRVV
jgi:hypothetical protein